MNRIKQLRTEKHLTLKELGNKIHIGINSISQYENETRYPKLETWQKLADFFKVSVPYIQGKSNIKSSDVDKYFTSSQTKSDYVIAFNANPGPAGEIIITDDLEKELGLANIKVFDSEGNDITNQEGITSNNLQYSGDQVANNNSFILKKYQNLLSKALTKSKNGDRTAQHIFEAITSLLDVYDN
ncbi:MULTISPECIES: helix-turn-helix transcriptional regulator [Lactobacillus]|uniref:helix-turn-helix domain-containing protein n=1 Tax=Lactobacillus TaxID=1578 RepID=UPI0018DD926A|nr:MULTISPECIES: helix-turn-helix transcriptional regulator [Lactobacillus]MBI0022444.1 helix-turn-helix transcriptional regulator [Lactobacillus sp. W8172]